RHVSLFVSPSNGLALEQRASPGGATVYTPGSGAAPVWLKLTRTGTLVTASRSTDGLTWTPVGNYSLASGTVYIGLAVTSHHAGVLGTVTFDNVAVASARPPSS